LYVFTSLALNFLFLEQSRLKFCVWIKYKVQRFLNPVAYVVIRFSCFFQFALAVGKAAANPWSKLL